MCIWRIRLLWKLSRRRGRVRLFYLQARPCRRLRMCFTTSTSTTPPDLVATWIRRVRVRWIWSSLLIRRIRRSLGFRIMSRNSFWGECLVCGTRTLRRGSAFRFPVILDLPSILLRPRCRRMSPRGSRRTSIQELSVALWILRL